MDHPLRLYRKSKTPPISLLRVAEALDVTEAQVSRIERGLRTCTAEMAKKIEEFSDGEISRAALRPDLWDAPAETVAA